MCKRQGCTLVEISIIMLILLVIMGMLFPALQEVTKRGREVSCSNNLKNLSMGIQQLSLNNRNKLPREDRHITKNLIKPDYFRGDEMKRMAMAKEVFTCPSRPIIREVDGAYHGSEFELGIKNWETSFFYLANADGETKSWSTEENYVADGGDIRCKFRKRPKNRRNGRLPIWADKVSYKASSGEWEVNHIKELKNGGAVIRGGNVAYLDGSVKWQHRGHYPKQLLTAPGDNLYGNPVAVHDPAIVNYNHRYWW